MTSGESLNRKGALASVRFRVWGRPKPAGSHRTYGRGVITHADPKLRSWMQEVRSAAADAMSGRPLMSGPVILSCRFHFARPKKHYRTGKFADQLREDAPVEMRQKPDLSKLVRAVEDALTKTIWVDDCQVSRYDGVGKQWSVDGREYVDVWIYPIQE